MLKSIVLQNVEGHKRSILDLHPGVNFIVGSSNVGKSSILRALRWVLTNRLPKGKLIPWDDPKATVKVLLRFDDVSISRIKGPKVNEYRIGRQVLKAVGADVPEEVQKALRMADVNFQPQHTSHFLLADRPSEITAKFNQLADFEEIDALVKATNAHKREVRTLRQHAENELRQTEVQLVKLATVDNAAAFFEEVERLEKELRLIEEDFEALQELVKDIERTQDTLKPLIALDKAIDAIERIQDGYVAWESLADDVMELRRLVRRIEDLEEELAALDLIDEALVEARELSALVQEHEALRNEREELASFVKNVEDLKTRLEPLSELTDALEAFRDIQNLIEERKILAHEVEELSSLIETYEDFDARLSVLRNQITDLEEEAGELLRTVGCPLKESCPFVK